MTGVLLAGPLLALVLVPPAPSADEPRTGGSLAVETIKDIPYYEGKDADPKKHKLDLYLPKGQKDFPVLFFVHGGSWRNGDRGLYGKLGDVFARNGIGTVIISYRLTPAVQHPGHIQDVARALAWTQQNIAKHGGRPDRIFACGHSAGGHLVALLSTNESYLKAEHLSLDALRGVIPISGVYRIAPGRLSAVFGSDAEVCKMASPLAHVHEKLPPFLILYAEKDYPTLDKQAEELQASLEKAKVETAIQLLKDRDHITIIRSVANQEDPATQAILRFIAKHSEPKATSNAAKQEK